MICPKCKRSIPNKTHLLKNGCKWCVVPNTLWDKEWDELFKEVPDLDIQYMIDTEIYEEEAKARYNEVREHMCNLSDIIRGNYKHSLTSLYEQAAYLCYDLENDWRNIHYDNNKEFYESIADHTIVIEYRFFKNCIGNFINNIKNKFK